MNSEHHKIILMLNKSNACEMWLSNENQTKKQKYKNFSFSLKL